MTNEQFVQLAPDSTGKKIRNLEITAVQQDGTISTVEMQVVSIADTNGRPLDLDTRWDELISLLRLHTKMLAQGFDLDGDPDEDDSSGVL